MFSLYFYLTIPKFDEVSKLIETCGVQSEIVAKKMLYLRVLKAGLANENEKIEILTEIYNNACSNHYIDLAAGIF